MTILITGATGFIGSFLTELLVQDGHKVIAPTRSIKNGWRLQGLKNLTLIEGDIGQYPFQEGLFKQYKPPIVIHTAWEGMTRDKRDDPSQLHNLVMTDHLFRLSGMYQCSLFIGFGSQAEYGVHNKEINEDTLANPDNLYGVYKLSAGLLGKWYARKYGFNYAWLRLFSSFGPKDLEDYIIPYTVRSFLSGQAPRLGHCEARWDYLYVKDIARAVAKIIEKNGRYSDIYNLSSGQTVCLRDIIKTLEDMTRTQIKPQFGVVPQNPNGLMYLKGNNQKFEKTFGHLELTSLQEGLQETVNWYQTKGMALGRS